MTIQMHTKQSFHTFWCVEHSWGLISVALEAEVKAVLAELNQNGIETIRNGYLPTREVTTAIGNVEVKVPRIRSKKSGGVVNFTST